LLAICRALSEGRISDTLTADADFGSPIRCIWPGQSFGELALLHSNSMRTATVISGPSSSLASVPRDSWDTLGLFSRRTTEQDYQLSRGVTSASASALESAARQTGVQGSHSSIPSILTCADSREVPSLASSTPTGLPSLQESIQANPGKDNANFTAIHRLLTAHKTIAATASVSNNGGVAVQPSVEAVSIDSARRSLEIVPCGVVGFPEVSAFTGNSQPNNFDRHF
jgi:hypothetical protein